MHPIPEPDSIGLDEASQACLSRTRSAVLNVLIAVGLTIAISGWLLRGREPLPAGLVERQAHQVLTLSLVVLGVLSFLLRRIIGGRRGLSDPSGRASRFFWSHVLAAIVGADHTIGSTPRLVERSPTRGRDSLLGSADGLGTSCVTTRE